MKKSIGSLLFILCAFLLAACTRDASPANASQTCKLNLWIFIRQGPNDKLGLSGQVAFGSSTWSRFVGDFVEENRTAHPISLSFDGSVIHFTIEHAQGHIYGTGMMENDLAACTGAGGGTLSGPALGDLGDWRGQWIREQVKTSPQPPKKEAFMWELLSFLCTNLPFIAIALFIAFILFRLFVPTYKLRALFQKSGSATGKASSTSLRRINQAANRQPDGSRLPIAEYHATYTPEDKLFDLSFDIEKAARYMGECGITTTKISGMQANQVTAFEFWLFDAQDAQDIRSNTAKILMSDFCYNHASLRNETEPKGPAELIQPGAVITLETKTLTAKAKILQVEYEPGETNPQQVFKKVVIKIGVWTNKD